MAFVRLIAIAKDEAAYLAEWVHHHLYFGFDQITVILNDCTDNSLELLQQIASKEPRLLIRDGNPLKASCQHSGQNFQIAAYAQELSLVRQDSRVTHVMCLDIDEFWVTPALADSIHSYTDRYPEASSIAFTWHIEVPIDPKPFSPALQASYQVQKNRHVKSLNKLSDQLIKLGIHNAEHMDGTYILADGTVFEHNLTNGAPRAVLSFDSFAASKDKLDSAFTYHRLFRSQLEYLASLQRGRPNEQVLLKDNRWGYRTDSPKTPLLSVNHPQVEINKLNDDYQAFLDRHDVLPFIAKAQETTQARANATLADFKNPTPQTNQLTFLFAGLTGLHEIPDSYVAHITHHIDSITATDGGVAIKGWVIDKHSDRAVHIGLPEGLEVAVARASRPDVVRNYPGTHMYCGFRIELKLATFENIDIMFRCGHTSSTHALTLPAPTA